MLEQIAKVIKEYKEDDALVISETTTFEELELDSLDTVELVMNLEEELGTDIEMSEDIKSVGDLLSALKSK